MQARAVFRILVRDPVLLLVAGISVLSAGWLLPGFGSPAAGVLIAALLAPVFDVVIGVSARRLSRVPGTPVAARRFWQALALLGALWMIGDTGQIGYVLSHPGLTDAAPSDWQSAFSLTGIAVPLLVMLTYPQVSPTREARIRFWLDAGAVLTAAAVIMWYVAGNSAGEAVLESAVALIAAFAAARLLLSGAAPMSTMAAVPVLAAAALQCFSGALASHAADHLPTLLALEVVAPALTSLGPRIQDLLVRHAISSPPKRARPYSLLPYAMLVVVFALLPLVLPVGLQLTAVITLAGLAVVTGLVVLRQLAVFGEFNRVVSALDASLLEARELEDRLRYQTQHDSLTGLANRALFGERLSATVATGAAVLHIDLDGFKIINDTYGHHVGDAVLVEVAARLRGCVVEGGLAARLGGDEFAVLLPGDGTAVAEAVAERFRTMLRVPIEADGRPLAVGASIGVAAGSGGDPEELLRHADEQMYQAKHLSRPAVLATAELATAELATAALATAELATAELATAELATAELATAELATAAPATAELAVAAPAVAPPATAPSFGASPVQSGGAFVALPAAVPHEPPDVGSSSLWPGSGQVPLAGDASPRTTAVSQMPAAGDASSRISGVAQVPVAGADG